MRNFVTFGLEHMHDIYGMVFDKDCVASFDSIDAASGRERAFKLFGNQFCMHYTQQDFSWSGLLNFFPRGVIYVP